MRTEEIISLTEFKNDPSRWIERLQHHQPPIILTQSGKARAVLESYEAWQQSQNALAMLQIIGRSGADVTAGRTYTTEEVFVSAQTRLKERLNRHRRG